MIFAIIKISGTRSQFEKMGSSSRDHGCWVKRKSEILPRVCMVESFPLALAPLGLSPASHVLLLLLVLLSELLCQSVVCSLSLPLAAWEPGGASVTVPKARVLNFGCLCLLCHSSSCPCGCLDHDHDPALSSDDICTDLQRTC
jgi:hypothetical protein